jgi:hypothetical protein
MRRCMTRPAISELFRPEVDILPLLDGHFRMTLLASDRHMPANQRIACGSMVERSHDLPSFCGMAGLARLVGKPGAMGRRVTRFAVGEILC